jgi:uncharacterized membrane protein YebE (DUF533 family)
MNFMAGRKTYIVAAILALATAAKSLGVIDEAAYQLIAQLLGAAGAMTVAHKLVREATAN